MAWPDNAKLGKQWKRRVNTRGIDKYSSRNSALLVCSFAPRVWTMASTWKWRSSLIDRFIMMTDWNLQLRWVDYLIFSFVRSFKLSLLLDDCFLIHGKYLSRSESIKASTRRKLLSPLLRCGEKDPFLTQSLTDYARDEISAGLSSIHPSPSQNAR